MGNPNIARRPFVLVERNAEGFSVGIWHPPTGIWQQEGATFDFPDQASAVEYAAQLVVPRHATLAQRVNAYPDEESA